MRECSDGKPDQLPISVLAHEEWARSAPGRPSSYDGRAPLDHRCVSEPSDFADGWVPQFIL